MLQFSPDERIKVRSKLVQELFENVLYDEQALFISDEATLWDVSMGAVDEVLDRLRNFYGVSISLEETQQPLWQFLQLVDDKRYHI